MKKAINKPNNKKTEILINLSKIEELSKGFSFSIENIDKIREILEELFSKTSRVNAMLLFSKIKKLFKAEIDDEKALELTNEFLKNKKLIWKGFYVELVDKEYSITKGFTFVSNENRKVVFRKKEI